MADSLPTDSFDSGVEALVRSAANLPRISPDLRPRVIEAAIAAGQRRWHRRRAAVIATITLMFVALPPPSAQSPDGISIGHRADQEASQPGHPAYGDPLLASSVRLWGGGGTGSEWELVDSFTRLRQDHLRMLRQAF